MGRSRHQGIAVVAATIDLAAGIVHAQPAEGLKHRPALVVGALKRLQQCRLRLLIKRCAQPDDGISGIDDGGFVIGLQCSNKNRKRRAIFASAQGFEGLAPGDAFVEVVGVVGSSGQESLKGLGGLAGSKTCLLYTSPSPRDLSTSRMPSSA